MGVTGHATELSGTRGEIRWHGHTVALLTRWTRGMARRDRRVGTAVVVIEFSVTQVNQFWANFGTPTHVALPTKSGGRGPRRVYELLTCDLKAGRATVLARHVAKEAAIR